MSGVRVSVGPIGQPHIRDLQVGPAGLVKNEKKENGLRFYWAKRRIGPAWWPNLAWFVVMDRLRRWLAG